MANPTPAKRLHKLAAFHGLAIQEFSPGLRVWSIVSQKAPNNPHPLAWAIPQSELAEKIIQLSEKES